MSHTITLTFNDINAYKNTCEDLTKSLDNILENVSIEYSFQNEINNLKHNINELNSKFIPNHKYDDYEYMQMLQNLSTYSKMVVNSVANAQTQLNKNIINCIEQNEFNYYQMLQKHGIATIEVVEYMHTNNIKLNQDSFIKCLEIVESNNLTEQKLKTYHNQAFELIDNSCLNNELKYVLKDQIRDIKQLNQLKDINAIIQTKIDEYKRLIQFSKTIINLLANQRFKIIKNKIQWSIDQYNNIVLKLAMCNDANNTVNIYIDSNNQLKYKLGNYIGHACEKTTKKLIEDLNKCGIKITNMIIKRDFEEPKQMQQSFNNQKGQ